MPIYDWECSSCHYKTTSVSKIEDRDTVCLEDCPCMENDYKQVIIRPTNCKGFILLGDHHWHDREYSRTRSIK